jgi:hypothetical protein
MNFIVLIVLNILYYYNKYYTVFAKLAIFSTVFLLKI